VFSDYSKLSTVVYSLGDDKRKITALYIYVDILSQLDSYVHDTFFEEKRGNNNILVRKNGVNISATDYENLTKQVAMIFDFYQRYKSKLDMATKRDTLIAKNLEILNQKFKEYFLALENYESYKYNYDETRKTLLTLQTGNNTNIVFDTESVTQYLSSFQGADTRSMKLDFHTDPLSVSVSSYYINGNNFSFDLFPLSEYLMENIVLNGKNVNASYKLNLIEADWEEKQLNVGIGGDTYKYDFTYFFLNTFFTQQVQQTEIFQKETPQQEDKVIVVFKRDKLLGDK